VGGTDDAGLLDLLDESHANSHTGSVGVLQGNRPFTGN